MRSAILFCLFVVFCVSTAFAAVKPQQASSSAASSVSASAAPEPSAGSDNLLTPDSRRQVARLVTTANTLNHGLRAALADCAAESRTCDIADFRKLAPQFGEMRNAVTDILDGLVASLLDALKQFPVLGPLLAGLLQPVLNLLLPLLEMLLTLLTGGA
ncbi:hypothetical protein BCR43DRAFT_496025 [Syncephalastrum racemosum]|uniref:Uncharacterized protein n=1 Tax=Syncephalastrum racemosum TaxID=13706 RepID=A0A1X2H6T7_SYNRA|nr:hypothetical protein BCR43DRAFT_496025 [Syncephalastrum racemosum]